MKQLLPLLLAILLAPHAFADSTWDPQQAPSLFSSPLNITVYHSKSCGCCKDWISHLEKHNFIIENIPSNDMHRVKNKLGVPAELASCHTALINGYVIEGHVPAEDIKHLVNSKPEITGLSVPQMPHGTPGMETGRQDDFQVISFDNKGNYKRFNSYQFDSANP